MKRRVFLKTAGLVTVTLGCKPALAALDKRPNLLIIHTDEHNFRTLGCYRDLMTEDQAFVWGKEAVCETPHIDSIAKSGAVCTSFYGNTPVCSPSRGSFISGRYPQNTPVTTNDVALDDSIISFAETLDKVGYATGYAGKWHLDGGGKPQWAPRRQFGFADNRYMFNRGHWKQFEETGKGPRVKARNAKDQPTYDVKGADEKTFSTDWLCDKTVDFLNANKGKPFCYMLSLPDPHGPNSVRAPYDTMYKDMKFEAPRTMGAPESSVPGWGKKEVNKFNGALLASYFGMVKCIDDNVGKILAALQKNGQLDNTIVVFTSDHGDMCFEHGRHNKGVPFETSAKVAFVVRYPAKIKAGTVVREVLSCVDFLPTVLKLMGVKTAGKEEGRDASALFTTGNAPADWDDIAFVRSTGSTGKPMTWIAAITSRYKLVFSRIDTPWLYDLKKDPDELINQFGNPDYKAIARDMTRGLLAYAKKYNDVYMDDAKVRAEAVAIAQ